jgi:hypothetical protein
MDISNTENETIGSSEGKVNKFGPVYEQEEGAA